MTRSLLTLLLLAGACRPEAGAPKYPDQQTLNPTQTNEDFLPGEAGFSQGDERLSLSVFYEGGFSEQVVIDDVTRHFYIWDNTWTQVTTDDRIEGLFADEVVVGGVGWWGGGVTWDAPEDLSAWTQLHIALNSSDAGQADLELLIESGATGGSVAVADYGFLADGNWHFLTIPTADFVGVDWSAVTLGLAFNGVGSEGDTLRIDDVYYTKGAR